MIGFGDLSPLEQKVLATIDMNALIEAIKTVVAVPSLDGSEDESRVQEVMADLMRQLGFDVDMWEIDFAELSQHPGYSVEVDRARGVGVVGRYGRATADGKSLVLNGHTDVVPAGELENWQYPPWEATVNEDEGRIYGRGVLDMKGALLCGVFAVKAIMDAGVELAGHVAVQSVIGEEDGGVGTLASIMRGHVADAAVVMEPTELMISPAQAGAHNFRVSIPGMAAHGALRDEGVDPLEKFLLIYQAILMFEKVRNLNVSHPMFKDYALPYPICVGTIQGGVWASTVMETLTFEGRLGIQVDEDPQDARRAFEKLLLDTAAADPWLSQHPPILEWWGGTFDPASIAADHPIVTTVSESYTVITGQEPLLRGMPYGADMRLLINYGEIPTVMFGPGDVRKAHQPDEFVPIAELETAVRTLALTVLRFCGVYEEASEVNEELAPSPEQDEVDVMADFDDLAHMLVIDTAEPVESVVDMAEATGIAQEDPLDDVQDDAAVSDAAEVVAPVIGQDEMPFDDSSVEPEVTDERAEIGLIVEPVDLPETASEVDEVENNGE